MAVNSPQNNSNFAGNSQDSVWGSESFPNNSDNVWGSSDSGQSDDIWGSSSQQNDVWGSPSTQSDDGWGSPSQPNDSSSNGKFADFGGNSEYQQDTQLTQQNTGEVQPSQGKKFNFGYKTVGLICGGIFLLVAIILIFINSIKVTPKDNQQPVQQPVQQTAQQPVQQGQQQSGNVQTQTNGNKNLIPIPADTALNYSGEVLSASGVVSKKLSYLDDHQVIYCIEILINVGNTSFTADYYCNYAPYQQVGVGDLVTIKYQQVSDGFISISEIKK